MNNSERIVLVAGDLKRQQLGVDAGPEGALVLLALANPLGHASDTANILGDLRNHFLRAGGQLVGNASGQTTTSSTGTSATTGTICDEMMTATFCNTPTGPNTSGYGSNGGAAATSTGVTTPSPAVPTCGEGIVTDNELCN
jgi:hypothetical protein